MNRAKHGRSKSEAACVLDPGERGGRRRGQGREVSGVGGDVVGRRREGLGLEGRGLEETLGALGLVEVGVFVVFFYLFLLLGCCVRFSFGVLVGLACPRLC